MPNSSRHDEGVTTRTEESEVESLKQELHEEHQRYLRALADFDNYRRRIERERAGVAQREKRGLLLSLVDLLDGFELAIEHGRESPSPVSAGVEAIYRKLLGLLEAQGVVPFDSEGEMFDPELHEAIASEPSGNHQEAGRITDQVSRGYRWGDELLRPARVRVAQ